MSQRSPNVERSRWTVERLGSNRDGWLFWSHPERTIERLAAILEPSGRLAITHLPRHGNPTPADTDRAAERIEQQMIGSGLFQVGRSYLELEPAPAVCVIGHRADPNRVVRRETERSLPR